jgi:hypothetical protein
MFGIEPKKVINPKLEAVFCTAPHFCGHFLCFQFVELYATFFPFSM